MNERKAGHHGLDHQIAEAHHRLERRMPGTRPSTGIHSTSPATTIATSSSATGRRRRRLGPHQRRGHRADHQDGDHGDGHRRPLEADQDRVHRRRPGQPPDDVVGQPQQEQRGHRQHQDQPLGDQGGERPVGGQVGQRPGQGHHRGATRPGEDADLPPASREWADRRCVAAGGGRPRPGRPRPTGRAQATRWGSHA